MPRQQHDTSHSGSATTTCPIGQKARRRCKLSALTVSVSALLASLSGPAAAVVYTWQPPINGSGSGNWNSAANWFPAAVPASGSETGLNFNASAFTTMTQNAASPLLVNRLDFSSVASGYTIGGNGLQFAGGGQINSLNANVTQTINTPVALLGSMTISTTGFFVMGGALSNASSSNVLSKRGGGTLLLNGSSSFNGTLDVAEGGLTLSSSNINQAVNVGAGALFSTFGNATSALAVRTLSGAGTVAVNRDLYLVTPSGQTFAGSLLGARLVSVASGDFNLTGASPRFTGAFSVSGRLNLGHADALAAAELLLAETGSLTVAPGLPELRLVFFDGAAASVADLGSTSLLLTLQPGGSNTVDGNFFTTGSLTLAGNGSQTFAGSTQARGTVRARDQASLTIAGDPLAAAYAAQDQASLTIGARQLVAVPVTAGAGSTVNYTSAELLGGTLGGAGTHNVAAVTRFSGTTFAAGVTINPANGATLVAVNNLGTVNLLAGRTVSFSLGSNQLGTLNVAGTAQVNGWASVGGRVAISPGGSLVASGGDLALGAGAIVTLGSAAQRGGTLTLSDAGATVQLGGSLLVNNGTLNGRLAVNYGSLAKGAGTFNGAVTVNDGGRFSPGNSPGTATTGDVTWGAGGGYLVELASATGTAGTAWDLWNVSGVLGVTAGTTANSVFTVTLATLDATDGTALLAGFNPAQNYSWTILRTSGGISGFDVQHLALNSSGFLNATQGGSFALARAGNDLVLNFTAAPVPEPGTWAMWAAGLGVAGLLRRRRLCRA